MDDDNYATVLESFVGTSSLQVVQVNTKKVFGSCQEVGYCIQESKSEAHEALSLLFQQDGVSPVIICDNVKEMIHGEFNRKF